MNWKQSLDRYLTSPPDDGFDFYCEQLIENISNDVYIQHEDYLVDSDDTNRLYEQIFNRGYTPSQGAKIVELILKES